MKKSKGQTIDLLYTNKKETNKKTSKKKKSVGTTSSRPLKNKKIKNTQSKKNDIINLDNEMVIGLTPKKKEEKKQKTTRTKTNNIKINSKKKTVNKKQNQIKKRKLKIIKWLLLLGLIITAIVLFMMSSIFNIKEIIVVNNSKIPSEEIINLSTLTTEVNMFKITNGTIKDGIKENAYIEEVTVKRKINGVVTLDIKERVATYMLKFANAYVYINNQGYMLEVSDKPLELPIISGFTTINEEIKVGNRLNKEDLQKLEDVIKIIEASKNTPLANIITEIDISNNDYKLKVTSENKTIKIGEMTNINIKLQMAGKILEAESGKIGEIYFQEGGKKAVFKEEVVR